MLNNQILLSRCLKGISSYGLCLMLLNLTGCACTDSKPSANHQRTGYVGQIADASDVKEQKIITAVAHLRPVKGNNVHGIVTFTKVANGVKVVADVEGLKPGKHGFHIHEHGDCGGEEASAAGAHFNPDNSPHGSPDDVARHVGDLGNLIADEHGHAHYQRVDKRIALEGEDGIVGRSVIIHADVDDYKTQPAGASGAKISCGVIEAVATY